MEPNSKLGLNVGYPASPLTRRVRCYWPLPTTLSTLYMLLSRDGSVGIAPGYGLDDLGFDSWRGLGIFLFDTRFRPVLGPTQPSIQRVPGALSLGVKRPGRETDHSPTSSAEVNECVELYLHSPNSSSGRGA
jgi:hypothetical protein